MVYLAAACSRKRRNPRFGNRNREEPMVHGAILYEIPRER
jgi:hypothetical protein